MLLVPQDLDIEDPSGPFILLVRDEAVIRYQLTRFLKAMSMQMGLHPWCLLASLSKQGGVTFDKYCLPFSKGEKLWVEVDLFGHKQMMLSPVLRDTVVLVEKFTALNPFTSNQISQEFEGEKHDS